MRWYTGDGSHEDEDAGIALVQQARLGRRWLACDCLPPDRAPPILTPAFLSEAETYYLRRLTSPKRPEHDPNCPFSRDQSSHRLSEVRRPDAPAEPPTGYFEVLKPAPEQLAQRPDDDASDDRTRQASTPRLARLLWRLLNVAGLNRCLPAQQAGEMTISREFRRLTAAAARIAVAPGIELGRVLWTHPAALYRQSPHVALEALSPRWPSGHAPQAFLTLFAKGFRGTKIFVPDGDPVEVVNRVQSPATKMHSIEGPFLVIIAIGEYPPQGYAPLRAYAQPIYSGHHFMPIEFAFERLVLRALLLAQRALDRMSIDVFIEKPIFDRLTPIGVCRPSFLLEGRSRTTGETKLIAIEALASGDTELTELRRAALAPLNNVVPLIEVGPDDITNARVLGMISTTLGL